jgi:MFS family permease
MMDPAVLALAVLGLVDSISFMIVAPSLAFYVEKLGGTQEAYGFILAVYSFASFCGKPILGRWSDAQGFRVPYMISISLSNLGGLLYAIAPAYASTQLVLVALGRILGGLGRANSALGFAYVARALPASERTSVTAVLGGVQMIGMAIAPLFSAFLADVNFDLCGIHFDNLNSVGLVLLAINFLTQLLVYFLLPDLPPNNSDEADQDGNESEWLKMFRFIFKIPHIGIPFLTIFTFNFNWQFIETALAPASADALGWVRFSIICLLPSSCRGRIATHHFNVSLVNSTKILLGSRSSIICSGCNGCSCISRNDICT